MKRAGPIAEDYRHVCAKFSVPPAAFVPLSPQRQLVGFDRFSGQPRLFSPYFVRLNRRFWAGADSLPDKWPIHLFPGCAAGLHAAPGQSLPSSNHSGAGGGGGGRTRAGRSRSFN